MTPSCSPRTEAEALVVGRGEEPTSTAEVPGGAPLPPESSSDGAGPIILTATVAEPEHRPTPALFRSIVIDPLRAFARLEAAGGIVLFGAALVAFVLANSPW